MQLSQFGDQQDRLQLDPDHGETLNAFLFGDAGSSFRAAEIACYFTRSVSRVGIAYFPKPASPSNLGATLYVTTTSYLGNEPIGGTGSTAIIGPNSAGDHAMYIDVIPADRIWLNIGINVSPTPNVVDDYWQFTIIGSNNLHLGVTP